MFPTSFYKKRFQKGNIFVLANHKPNGIESSAVLFEK